MERRLQHRVVTAPSNVSFVRNYKVTAKPTTDNIPGYWRLVTVKDAKVRVRQYPHAEMNSALAHFGWFVTAHCPAKGDLYVSIEDGSGRIVDEYETVGGSVTRPPRGGHDVAPVIPLKVGMPV
ncbi:hypothetical protein SEA_RIZWANA_101 [Arthrobacter phage Rizwana]|nr:hypothetical protein SEA_RIZWANA_101 [Arthrobacter phage Rizwana]